MSSTSSAGEYSLREPQAPVGRPPQETEATASEDDQLFGSLQKSESGFLKSPLVLENRSVPAARRVRDPP